MMVIREEGAYKLKKLSTSITKILRLHHTEELHIETTSQNKTKNVLGDISLSTARQHIQVVTNIFNCTAYL